MNGISALFIVVLLIAIIVLGPLAFIWALNTLFPVLAIAYGFKTWLAALLLMGTVASRTTVNNK